MALVAAECLHRQAHGKPLTQEQLARRYPTVAAQVWPLLQKPADSVATVDFLQTSGTTPVGGGPAPAPARAAPPAAFGRYRIRAELGGGGMGKVFLAYDPQLDRQVALKVPSLVVNSPEGRARFIREARAAAAVMHRNLCPIYEAGEIDGVPYYTMAYIQGDSLAQRIARGRPQPAEAVDLVRRVALAMQKAHSCNVVHRDLKPGNIMLDAEGEPVVVDFGLARITQAEASLMTRPGDFVGTMAYAPPEQVRGEVHAMGPAVDVYSLGAILYELLTGRRPAPALSEAPAPMTGVDRRLEAVCLKALAKKADERYPSMTAFAEALQALSIAPPTTSERTATPGGMQQAARPLWPRRRILAAGLAGCALCGLLGVAALVILNRPAAADHPAADLVRPATKDGAPAPPPAGLREPRFVRAFQHDDKVLYIAVPTNKDKHVMISASRDGAVKLWDWDMDSEKPRRQLDGKNGFGAAFAPDGSSVLLWPVGSYSSLGLIWDYERNKQTPLSISGAASAAMYTIVFSPRADRILVGTSQGIHLVDTDEFKTIRTFPAKRVAQFLALDQREQEVGQFLAVQYKWDTQMGVPTNGVDLRRKRLAIRRLRLRA